MNDLLAHGILKLGLERFLAMFPLLGGILASWTLVEDASVKTMAIGYSEHDGWRIYFAPAFVKQLPSLDQLVAVLLHEARHAIYDHCFQTEEDFPDSKALIIAQETVVNERMPVPLPPGALLLENFPGLPADECTEDRYHRLAKQGGAPKMPASQGNKNYSGTHQGTEPSRPNRNKNAGSEQTPNGSNIGGKGKQKGHGQASGNSAPGGSGSDKGTDAEHGKGSEPSAQDPEPLDDHGRWNEVQQHASQALSDLAHTIDALIEQGVKPSEYELVEIEHASKQRGLTPGQGMSLLARALQPKPIPWIRILRRYAGRIFKSRPSLRRPPRRFPALVGIVQGRASQADRPRIMAVIDTSGSMSDEVLAALSGELLRLTQTHEVWVVECDAEIHRHYRLKEPIKAMHGRGGTSFRPPFEKAFLKKLRPDLIVYLTDGYGDAPEKAPKMPVLWLLTTDIDPPVSWGRVVRIHPEGA